MALQIFGADSIGSGPQADLGTLDDMYVAAGVIVGREDAFLSTDYTVFGTGGNHFVHIDGRVMGGQETIALGDDASGDSNNHVRIGATGTVETIHGSAYAITLTGHSSIVENAGTIYSLGSGITVEPNALGGFSSIENSGSIIVKNIAILRVGGTQELNITNTGLISSQGNALLSIGVAVDEFTNNGYIEGDVNLGSGDDVYDGSMGTIAGDIFGGAGNDTLIGGAGAETFFSGPGIDLLRGGGGNDQYLLDISSTSYSTVVEFAGQGIDAVTVNESYTLSANVENLTLATGAASSGTGNVLANIITGDSQQNTLRGLAGNDRLFGDFGNDFLIGGAGGDRLTGGLSADRFIFNSVAESRAAGGIDRIMDFSRAQLDKIQLTAIDADTTKAGNQAFKFIGTAAFSGAAAELRFQKTGTDSIITADVNGDGKADLTIISDVAWNFIKADFVL